MAEQLAGSLNRSRQTAGQRQAISDVQPVRHHAMAHGTGKENARRERRAGVHGQDADRPLAQKRRQGAGEENASIATAFDCLSRLSRVACGAVFEPAKLSSTWHTPSLFICTCTLSTRYWM